ncbi:MAG: KOW motif-containing protein [Lentisphaerota bacterium]
MQKKTHVKTGDEVKVLAGKWKGEDAKIKANLKEKDRVVLEFSGLSPEKKKQLGVKTVKKSQQNPKGGIIERTVSVHISNVKLKNGNLTKPTEKI